MKNDLIYLETETEKYPICFNLNVMEAIQEAYGTMTKWGEAVESIDGEPKIKDLKTGLLIMINEAIDMENETNEVKRDSINSSQLGRIISAIGLNKVTEIIKQLTIKSTKTDDEQKNA